MLHFRTYGNNTRKNLYGFVWTCISIVFTLHRTEMRQRVRTNIFDISKFGINNRFQTQGEILLTTKRGLYVWLNVYNLALTALIFRMMIVTTSQTDSFWDE